MIDCKPFLHRIPIRFTFILVLVVQLNLNFHIALSSLEADFKSTKNKGVVMATRQNEKVPCLICTCIDRNTGLVAHTIPLCSIVIVTDIKKKNDDCFP